MLCPNGNEYIMKPIDLDRSIKDKVVDVSGYNGGDVQNALWLVSKSDDWKQLGLLATEIILGIPYHNL